MGIFVVWDMVFSCYYLVKDASVIFVTSMILKFLDFDHPVSMLMYNMMIVILQ
jgi:hypothetical protein